jgi:Ser/Thr protein kinase RdoA (MazF antagonist)
MQDDIDVRNVLESQFDDYEVRGPLHDVPPHAVYEVVVEGRRAVCKIARRPEADPAAEARVMAHVRRETSLPVPEVLAVGGERGGTDGDGWFVAEWLDAVPRDVEPPVGEAWARAAGGAMAALHAETGFDRPGFPRAGDGGGAGDDGGAGGGRLVVDARDSWHDVVCEYVADLRDWLDPHGHGDVAADVLAFLRDHPGVLDGCGEPVVCHGNFGLEHVGVEAGAVTSVIDFEHALVAPGEYDYWRTAVPVFIGPSGPESDAPHEAFRAGYESVRPLPDGFDRRGRVYRVLYTTWAFQSLHLQRNVTGGEARERAETFRRLVDDGLDDLRAALD